MISITTERAPSKKQARVRQEYGLYLALNELAKRQHYQNQQLMLLALCVEQGLLPRELLPDRELPAVVDQVQASELPAVVDQVQASELPLELTLQEQYAETQRIIANTPTAELYFCFVWTGLELLEQLGDTTPLRRELKHLDTWFRGMRPTWSDETSREWLEATCRRLLKRLQPAVEPSPAAKPAALPTAKQTPLLGLLSPLLTLLEERRKELQQIEKLRCIKAQAAEVDLAKKRWEEVDRLRRLGLPGRPKKAPS